MGCTPQIAVKVHCADMCVLSLDLMLVANLEGRPVFRSRCFSMQCYLMRRMTCGMTCGITYTCHCVSKQTCAEGFTLKIVKLHMMWWHWTHYCGHLNNIVITSRLTYTQTVCACQKKHVKSTHGDVQYSTNRCLHLYGHCTACCKHEE